MTTKGFFRILSVIFSIILTILAESTVPRASFGETCGSNGARCDSRLFLTCVENKCECLKQKEMKFDKSQGKCLVLSGERCTYISGEDSLESKLTAKLDCVENAKCNNDGFCSCLQNYYEDTQGLCVPKQNYGHECSAIQKCQEDKFLVCVDGICRCNDTDTIFDSDRNQCVFKAGRPCPNKEPCVNNAFCRNERLSGGFSYEKADKSRKCKCHYPYKASKSGLCLAEYNMDCNSKNTPCVENLACINGKCNCPFPGHQTYKNDGSNKCISLLRGPCKENISGKILNFSCTFGAECQTDEKTGVSECQCSKGFIESNNRTCGIEYGQECEATKGQNPCDNIANLVCKNGKCVCPDFQVYNKQTLKCQGLDGEKCNLETAKFEDVCVHGAYCHRYRDDKLGKGVCRCGSKWVADSNRKCVSKSTKSTKSPKSKSTEVYNVFVFSDTKTKHFSSSK